MATTAKRLLHIFGLIVLALTVLPWRPAVAARMPDAKDLVQVELIADTGAVRAGEEFWVGIRLTMAEHWHTYWRNPGDSGLATSVEWTLPEGFSAGEIVWPSPGRIPVGPLVNFGYEGRETLLTQITAPATVSDGATVPIQAHVFYLVCEEVCIPGEATVAMQLPVGPSAAAPSSSTRAFAAARDRLPRSSPWSAHFAAKDDIVVLRVGADGLRRDTIKSAFFFPHSETLIENAKPQRVGIDADGLTLALPKSRLWAGVPERVDGVLAIEEDVGGSTVRQTFTIEATPGEVKEAQTMLPARGGPSSGIGPWRAALLALLGGLLLNLMPCVFPVLSMKALHIAKHAGEGGTSIRLQGLTYTVGVLVSFLVVAGVLMGVRAGGAEVGWGFQLQSPIVIAALAYILFAVGLSLSGVVHVGASLMGAGGALASRPGLVGSFFTGVLATIVATPCTAPFMGAAVGFALTQPPVVGLSVFLALGLGLALPFLLLSLVPGLHRLLPRPGAWMDTLKQLLAFPIYATVVWLIWVLSQQVGSTGLLAALSGLLLIGFAAWCLDTARRSQAWRERLGQGAAILAAVIAILLIAPIAGDRRGVAGAAEAAAVSAEGIEPFSQARLDGLLAENRPVFVNMTAAWCITCLVNERAVLSTAAVRGALADRNIAYLKGDWTNQNPEITRVLERYGRSGVPLYLFYSGEGEPVVLPQILTEAAVLEQVARIPRG